MIFLIDSLNELGKLLFDNPPAVNKINNVPPPEPEEHAEGVGGGQEPEQYSPKSTELKQTPELCREASAERARS